MAHISKEQTVQYILTLIDDTLQVQIQSSPPNAHIYINIHFLTIKKLFKQW